MPVPVVDELGGERLGCGRPVPPDRLQHPNVDIALVRVAQDKRIRGRAAVGPLAEHVVVLVAGPVLRGGGSHPQTHGERRVVAEVVQRAVWRDGVIVDAVQSQDMGSRRRASRQRRFGRHERGSAAGGSVAAVRRQVVRCPVVEVPVSHQVRLGPGESRVHVGGDVASGSRSVPDAHLVDLAGEKRNGIQGSVSADYHLVRRVPQRSGASSSRRLERSIDVEVSEGSVPHPRCVVPCSVIEHRRAGSDRRSLDLGRAESEELHGAVRQQVHDPGWAADAGLARDHRRRRNPADGVLEPRFYGHGASKLQRCGVATHDDVVVDAIQQHRVRTGCCRARARDSNRPKPAPIMSERHVRIDSAGRVRRESHVVRLGRIPSKKRVRRGPARDGIVGRVGRRDTADVQVRRARVPYREALGRARRRCFDRSEIQRTDGHVRHGGRNGRGAVQEGAVVSVPTSVQRITVE